MGLRAALERLRAWRDAYAEAVRRDNAEAARRDREDPGWRENTFDGPGSHVSLFAHLHDVARERGLEGDLERVFGRGYPRP